MKNKQSDRNDFSIFILPICLALGTGLGALFHNVGVGLGIGALVGTVLGLAAYYLRGSDHKD